MEFKEAMRVWRQVCDAHNSCKKCPLGTTSRTTCKSRMTKHPEEAEPILTKWAAEHPEWTIADDFFEKFPNAPRDDKNAPYPCAKDCGYSKPPYCERIPSDCANCWRRPLEEV